MNDHFRGVKLADTAPEFGARWISSLPTPVTGSRGEVDFVIRVYSRAYSPRIITLRSGRASSDDSIPRAQLSSTFSHEFPTNAIRSWNELRNRFTSVRTRRPNHS